MRARNFITNDVVITRWDENPDNDPRRVCFTCRYFEIATAFCHNKMKRCSSDKLQCKNEQCKCRKIFYYKIMRCELQTFHPDYELFMRGERVKHTLDEIEKERRDLEMEISCLKDIEAIKRKYDLFLNEKPAVVQDVTSEIDLDLRLGKKSFSYEDIHLDDIDVKATKLFTNTIQIFGFNNNKFHDNCNPVHHLIYAPNSIREKISVKFARPGFMATFHQNGWEFSVTGTQMVDLLLSQTKLEHAFITLKQYQSVASFIRDNMYSVFSKIHPYLYCPKLEYPWHFFFRNTTDFEIHFTMTVKRNDLEKYGEVILKLDGDVVVMSFNIKYIGRIETDTVTKEFQNLIESNKVKMRIEGEA